MEYFGNVFEGDLMDDGQIGWKDTEYVFSTLSAWASHCKRIVNPEKKNACGWTTVKYNGRKLEWYKNKWLQLQQARSEGTQGTAVPTQVLQTKIITIHKIFEIMFRVYLPIVSI